MKANGKAGQSGQCLKTALRKVHVISGLASGAANIRGLSRIVMYLLVNSKGIPVFVKYDSAISYMPVFQIEKNAAEAAKNLMNGAIEAIRNTTDEYSIRIFDWGFFKEWQARLDQQHIMLFVYPMSPKDYGSKE